ncbi:MAG: hypothetical protein HY877_06235 [Deltaproteobacteria bacterium]|nr:hypothetical protein [Deltaproteobacteria bacterium]
MMRHSKHYFRAGFLILAGGLLFFVVRAFLIPSSFGKFGPFRSDDIKDQMEKPVQYGAPDACADCHTEIWQTHQKGIHLRVPCQDCHGPLSVHMDVEKGEFVGKMPIQKTSKLCLRCHSKLPSRPEAFPQIEVKEHLAKVPDANKPDICFSCHNPHSPKLTQRPLL